MEKLPCIVVALDNRQDFDVGADVTSDFGEFSRLMTNLGVSFPAGAAQADEWLNDSAFGRVIVGVTPTYGNVFGFGAVRERGEVQPCEDRPQGGEVDAYLLGLVKSQQSRSDGAGNQLLFIMPVMPDSKGIVMWVQPPHALSPDDFEQLPRYSPEMTTQLIGRPAEDRLNDVPLAPAVRGMIN